MLSLRFLNFYLYLKDSCVNLIYVVGSEENTYLFFGFIFSLKIRIVEFSLLLEHDRVFSQKYSTSWRVLLSFGGMWAAVL